MVSRRAQFRAVRQPDAGDPPAFPEEIVDRRPIRSEKPGNSSASSRRKSRNSHCGIIAMNGAGVAR